MIKVSVERYSYVQLIHNRAPLLSAPESHHRHWNVAESNLWMFLHPTIGCTSNSLNTSDIWIMALTDILRFFSFSFFFRSVCLYACIYIINYRDENLTHFVYFNDKNDPSNNQALRFLCILQTWTFLEFRLLNNFPQYSHE